MTWLPWFLLGGSVWLNLILFVLIYAGYQNAVKLERERDQFKALADVAIEELRKRNERLVEDVAGNRNGLRNLLSDLLKDWPASPRVH